jgi:hypothetical protein
MKQLMVIAALLVATAFSGLAADLDSLQGRWVAKKRTDDGAVTQTLEFKKDKWTFKYEVDGSMRFAAAGAVQVTKAGVYNSMRLHNMKFGETEADLNDLDDERHLVFLLQDGLLYVANALDRQRDDEKPSLDVYSKVADAAKSPASVVGNWKLDLKLNDNSYDYTLRVTDSDGKLSGVLVSPRSGEYKAKSISFEKDTLKMEVDRNIENTPVTFVFTGKLDGQALAGEAVVKGFGDDLTGSWTGKRVEK